MFIAALFTITKIWKQPKCPSVDEWIKKAVVHLQNGIPCSYKKKDILLFQIACRDLKSSMLKGIKRKTNIT
jgi:hypothetical protein